jgi:dihydrofolate reductase
MFGKNKKKPALDTEQHEQIEYAQKRIHQKKRLYNHIVIYLLGSLFMVALNKIFKYGEGYDWFIWGMLLWGFFLLLHAVNVFITHPFMGQEWERSQREKLLQKQKERMAELKREIASELPEPERFATKSVNDVILIAAAGEGNELGLNGKLPWHLPDDFKRFKALTTGHPMIMGRKTFDTFPKPLPKRRHIIVTRDTSYKAEHPSCEVVYSLEEALQRVSGEAEVYIIGGGEIYRQALPHATKVELTRVHSTFPADTFFPSLALKEWEVVGEEQHPADDRHAHSFTYLTFARKGSTQ